jgi:hypothetical protein
MPPNKPCGVLRVDDRRVRRARRREDEACSKAGLDKVADQLK